VIRLDPPVVSYSLDKIIKERPIPNDVTLEAQDWLQHPQGRGWVLPRLSDLSSEKCRLKPLDGLELLHEIKRSQASDKVDAKEVIPLTDLLGKELLSSDGTSLVQTDELEGIPIMLYFSAHWCPPCRFFTPQLAECYKNLKRDSKAVQVIFISADQDENQFKVLRAALNLASHVLIPNPILTASLGLIQEYLSEMPWLAVPFQDQERRDFLTSFFKVQGFPSLIVLDSDRRLITDQGREKVSQDPQGVAFPWDGSNLLMRTSSIKHPAVATSTRLKDRTHDVTMSTQALQSFRSRPLADIENLDEYAVSFSRQGAGLYPVPNKIPFDVSRHGQAQSAVARSMMSRLGEDVGHFATDHNDGAHPRLPFLMQEDMEEFIQNPGSANLVKAIKALKSLILALEALREEDYLCLNASLPLVQSMANHVSLPPAESMNGSGAHIDEASEAYRFFLRRYSGQEVTMWHEYLFGSVLSSKTSMDLRKLNPYLSESNVAAISGLVGSILLHTNRVGQTNRALLDARHLLSLLQGLKQSKAGPAGQMSTHLSMGGKALARALATERHYMDIDGSVFDPRFLVFEFCWNIVLRKKQVEMVREFVGAIRSGRSMVKQLIMGAGKTTVVGPLLCLILGEGGSMVMQVVPPALLEFSRSVLRTTFSSIMQKRVYTLDCDRATQVDANVCIKLRNAMTTNGVIISTPTTVKSFMLKFLESLDIVRDKDRQGRCSKQVEEASELARILGLFRDGILIMDEVDLILHPLKSELNFPIGPKLELDPKPDQSYLRWALPIHLLDAVFYVERRAMAVPFGQSNRAQKVLSDLCVTIQKGYESRALQRNPHLVLLNSDWYHLEMKPIMARWAYLWIEANHFTGISTADAISFMEKGPPSMSKSMLEAERAILVSAEEDLRQQKKPNETSLSRIETRWARITQEEESHALAIKIDQNVSGLHVKLLNLSHDWLKSFLPHCLQKIDRVSFGIMNALDLQRAFEADAAMPKTRAKLAIPFVGKDVPSRSSEFAHPDVVLGLTVLAYRYEGLRWNDFDEIIQTMRTDLEKEIGPFKERSSTLRHEAWVKASNGYIKGKKVPVGETEEEREAIAKREVVPLRLLKRSNEEQMRKLFNLIQFTPEAIHWYLETSVFQNHMRAQVTKLSANGNDLGGSQLFGRRIGFSGTPSDLLPLELGRCGYEKGSDGKMIHALTSPSICSYELAPESWTVFSLLDRIKTANEPRFHALIDTGALITGVSNKEVAKYLLKDDGMPWCEGVVYLDEHDRKMIVVRATGRSVKLEQCGISKNRRFAFYDQVHTTGMDIKHVLNATAVITLGKDMTFRDYAQGAFRMRGIIEGQRIHILLIPEVNALLRRELDTAGISDIPPLTASVIGKDATVLTSFTAWLVVNSMRSERVQFNALCMQNLANIWRKNALSELVLRHEEFQIDTVESLPGRLTQALNLFCEEIDFDLGSKVKEPRIFHETMEASLLSHQDWLVKEADKHMAAEVVSLVKEEGKGSGGANEVETELMTEMVQEEEEEKEEEKEKQQEIEIEKFIDHAYSREDEEPVPWSFSSLANAKSCSQFYPASKFALYKRKPLEFNSYLSLSSNYFNLNWSGERRIKNTVMILDWCPQSPPRYTENDAISRSLSGTSDALARTFSVAPSLQAAQSESLRKAVELFDLESNGHYTILDASRLIAAALDSPTKDAEVQRAISDLVRYTDQVGQGEQVRLSLSEIETLLQSGALRPREDGRYFVAVSLAEAETIRRIMHLRQDTELLDGLDTSIALRCLSSNNAVFDRSSNWHGGTHYHTSAACESLRFIDSAMYYKENQLNVLIRSLQKSTIWERLFWFVKILGCRRRGRKDHKGTPLSRVFETADEWSLLKHRAYVSRLRVAINERGIFPLNLAFRHSPQP